MSFRLRSWSRSRRASGLAILALAALAGCGTAKNSGGTAGSGGGGGGGAGAGGMDDTNARGGDTGAQGAVGGSAAGVTGTGDSAAGGGGMAGGGSAGGQGGAGGAGPAPSCVVPVPPQVTVQLQDADGVTVTTSLMERVTVRSVDGCANGVCSTIDSSSTFPSDDVRVVLANAASVTWTLYVHIPDMPDHYFTVGDTYDLSLVASIDTIFFPTVNQTLTLSQDGRLRVFGATLASFQGPLLPTKPADDLTLVNAGLACHQARPTCARDHYAVQVTHGGQTVTVGPGETAMVGTLSFVSAQFARVIADGVCDDKSPTVMAAFETNVCRGVGTPCVSGPASCCGDAQILSVCVGEVWTCPAGAVPVISCTGYGWSSSASCSSH